MMCQVRTAKVMPRGWKLMSKMDAKQSRILITVLVAVGILVAYKFGYTPISEKADEVIAENEELSGKLAELEEVRENEGQYRAELNDALAGIEDIKQRFAAGITPQKSIMMVRELEMAADMDIDNVSFNDTENVFTASFPNEAGEPIIANKSVLAISYKTSYEGFKKCMDFINSYGDYMNVESFTCAYNQETGLLMGSISINRYSLSGLGKVYMDPAVDGIGLSKDNIFGSMR